MEERIKQLIEYYELNPYSMSRKISVSEGTIRKFLAGQIGLKADTIIKILATFAEVSPDWLLFGKGAMIRENSPSSTIDGSLAPLVERIERLARENGQLQAENEELKKELAHIEAEAIAASVRTA